MYARLKAYC